MMEMIKKNLNKHSYTEKNLSIFLYTIHALFVLCGSFQLIVVVKMLSW